MTTSICSEVRNHGWTEKELNKCISLSLSSNGNGNIKPSQVADNNLLADEKGHWKTGRGSYLHIHLYYRSVGQTDKISRRWSVFINLSWSMIDILSDKLNCLLDALWLGIPPSDNSQSFLNSSRDYHILPIVYFYKNILTIWCY